MLVVAPAALLMRALVAPEAAAPAMGLGGGIALVGGGAAVREGTSSLDTPPLDRRDAADVLAVVVGAVVAYALSVHAGLGPVVGSALVGVAAGAHPVESGTPAYCGSFVGMASPAVFPGLGVVLIAGLVAGVAFVAARGVFAGVGGKLGTLAFAGCATTALATGVEFTGGGALSWRVAPLVVTVAAVAAVVTAVLSVRCRLGAVLGSALVGLAAGLLAPLALSGGPPLAAVTYCASFVGMSSAERLGREAHVGAAGALCGLVFVVVAPAYVGAGGKLGTTAFVAAVTVAGLDEVRERVR